MKKTRILSGVLAILMLVSSYVCVNAASINTNGGMGNTIVSYGMNEGFLVTIPADFTISQETNKAEATVSASNVMISHGATLKVSITGDDYVDKWELIDTFEDANRLEYTIGTSVGASDIVNNSVVLAVNASEAYNSTVSETLHFTVVDALTKAGVYTDTITFSVGLFGSSEVVGDGQVYDRTAPSALSFRAEQPISEFENVYLNDELVDPENYELVEGSTIIIFDEAFLNNLSTGSYTVSFEFKNTVISATFTVVVKEIEFTIDSVSLKAEAGMTWGEWYNSKYNTTSEYGFVDNIFCNMIDSKSGFGVMIYEDSQYGRDVFAEDVIVNGGIYKTSRDEWSV